MPPREFNSLGQILAAGGEVSIGIQIARGMSSGRALQLIQERYTALDAQDQATLLDISLQGVAAGEYLNGLGTDDPIDLSNIPVNGNLFGDDMAGRRLLVAGTMRNGNTGDGTDIREAFATVGTAGEMIRYLQSLIDNWSEEYPELAEIWKDEQESLMDWTFDFAERRF